jgi:hypothetical protein
MIEAQPTTQERVIDALVTSGFDRAKAEALAENTDLSRLALMKAAGALRQELYGSKNGPRFIPNTRTRSPGRAYYKTPLRKQKRLIVRASRKANR